MAEYTFGEGPDTLALYFYQDAAGGEPARVNFGVLPDGQFVGNTAEWQPVVSTDPAAPDAFIIRGDFPQDSAFFFTFTNDYFGADGDRNVHLLRAEANGVEIPGSAIDAYTTTDYGPVWYDGDAQAPEPEPPPPEPGRALNGTGGADLLTGGAGPDTIGGGSGDDTLIGGAGDDALRGGAGSDVLNGGTGSDAITTSGGRDAINFAPGDGRDTVTDFDAGRDSVWIGNGAMDVAVREETRDGVEGSVVFFAGDETGADEMWLPGATGLGTITIIA